MTLKSPNLPVPLTVDGFHSTRRSPEAAFSFGRAPGYLLRQADDVGAKPTRTAGNADQAITTANKMSRSRLGEGRS